MKDKSTYTLDMLRKTVCKNEKQVSKIEIILLYTLQLYQWEYQNTNDDQQYRDAKSSAIRARNKVVSLLRVLGNNTLADEVNDALAELPKDSYLTRKKVLSSVKTFMKSKCLIELEINKHQYNKNFSKHMERAFIEICEKYPLANAPEHFNSGFDPY